MTRLAFVKSFFTLKSRINKYHSSRSKKCKHSSTFSLFPSRSSKPSRTSFLNSRTSVSLASCSWVTPLGSSYDSRPHKARSTAGQDRGGRPNTLHHLLHHRMGAGVAPPKSGQGCKAHPRRTDCPRADLRRCLCGVTPEAHESKQQQEQGALNARIQ